MILRIKGQRMLYKGRTVMRKICRKTVAEGVLLLVVCVLSGGCAAKQEQEKPKETIDLFVMEEQAEEESGKESLSKRIRSAGWMEKTALPDRLSDLTGYSEMEITNVIIEFLRRYDRENIIEFKSLCGTGNLYWDEGKEFDVFEIPGDSFVAGNIL